MSPLTIAAIFLLFAALFSIPAVLVRDVYREWAASHKSLYQYIEPLDSIAFRINGLFNAVDTSLFGSSEPGLEQVRLYVSERRLKGLQSDLPASAKDWKKGQMVFPDGTLGNVQVRHRGDNPFNWLYEKKSWRVKTSKERMLGTVRSFNLISPQDPLFIDTHFYLRLAKACGLVTGDSRLVELVINGETRGVHTATDQLDENFLRNNNLMPVNLYKGEQRMSERRYGVEFDLYSSTALWSKDSVNNYTLVSGAPDAGADMSDLDYVMKLSQEALTGDAAFDRLRDIVDWSYWARFAAYEILAQHSYDALHNNRLVVDIWKGQVLPLPIDPQAIRIEKPEDVTFFHSGSRQGILDRLERNPAFRTATIAALREMLADGCLTRTIAEMQAGMDALKTSLSRDPAVYQTLGSQSYIGFDAIPGINRFLNGYEIVRDALALRLAAMQPVQWTAAPGRLTIVSGSIEAVGPFRLETDGAVVIPPSVYWDRNGSGDIDPGDVKLPVTAAGNALKLDARFAGNLSRISGIQQIVQENYGSSPVLQPAEFRLLFDQPSLQVSSLSQLEPAGPVEIPSGSAEGRTPNRQNYPLVPPADVAETVLSGDLLIEGVRIETGPVRIEAGTTVRMAEGAALILRGRTVMAGTAASPIEFRPDQPGRNWGVVALQGAAASGSELRHVTLSGGTGSRAGLSRFIAMLSVHDTSDILLDHLHLSDNAVEDDMIHIIYSRNVTIRDIVMENAMSDAIDIDISTVTVEGGVIEGSGNDAIDLMSSDAVIRGIRLSGNGDKGVSVGEGSKATIVDVDLVSNEIGVQSKDGSVARIENSRFEGNRLQLSAYQKNWRYADGGQIRSENSRFSADDGSGRFSADIKSRIIVDKATLAGPVITEGVVLFDSPSTVGQ
ncbi:MAG: CotH kinase family protein [Rhodospirillales bacterium]